MERCERVSVAADAGPVAADLTWRRLTTGMRLDEMGLPSVDAARHLDQGSEWQPVVVVCGPGVPSDDVEAILKLGEDGRTGIGVVVISGLDAPSFDGAIVVRPRDQDPMELSHVLGTTVVPQRMGADELALAAAIVESASLLGGADDDRGIDADPVPDPQLRATVGTSTYVARSDGATVRVVEPDANEPSVPAAGRVVPPSVRATGRRSTAGGVERVAGEVEFEVEVAVLGPVEIRGAARGFTRAWAKELVVYLAMHPGGASNETWATALWPERLMAPSSLHSTVSVARRSLGTARDGTDHLPRSHGRLALAPTVGHGLGALPGTGGLRRPGALVRRRCRWCAVVRSTGCGPPTGRSSTARQPPSSRPSSTSAADWPAPGYGPATPDGPNGPPDEDCW